MDVVSQLGVICSLPTFFTKNNKLSLVQKWGYIVYKWMKDEI